MNWIIRFIFSRIYQIPLLLSAYKAFKYLVRITTNTTEIYRLCNSTIITSNQLEAEGADEKDQPDLSQQDIAVPKDIIHRIDRSITYSTQLKHERLLLVQSPCSLDQILLSIVTKKQFPRQSIKSPAALVLSHSLLRIHQSNLVLTEIEQQITTKYDTSNSHHEEKLLQLWASIYPDIPLSSRHSKQWVDIGFQGTDPATDFRGMGLQGLNDLLYFVQTHRDHALSALQHASHPVSWYPYAIVGINITKFAYQMLESKKLQLYLFAYGTTISAFQEFYCYLFYTFDQFWINHEPKLSVMDFEAKFQEFKVQVEKDLLLESVMPLSELMLWKQERLNRTKED